MNTTEYNETMNIQKVLKSSEDDVLHNLSQTDVSMKKRE